MLNANVRVIQRKICPYGGTRFIKPQVTVWITERDTLSHAGKRLGGG